MVFLWLRETDRVRTCCKPGLGFTVEFILHGCFDGDILTVTAIESSKRAHFKCSPLRRLPVGNLNPLRNNSTSDIVKRTRSSLSLSL